MKEKGSKRRESILFLWVNAILPTWSEFGKNNIRIGKENNK